MSVKAPKYSVTYDAADKIYGGKKATAVLTSTCLDMGKPASKSECIIVDEFNTNWNVRDFINLSDVTANIAKIDPKKFSRMRSVDSLLKELKLTGILELADYSELNAQRWVRGHLLAQKLGGSGKSENLIPLDRNKNAVMEAFETSLYNFFKEARAAEKLASSNHYVRVNLTIKAQGSMSPFFSPCTPLVRAKLAKLPEKVTYKMATYYVNSASGKVSTSRPNSNYPKPLRAPSPLTL